MSVMNDHSRDFCKSSAPIDLRTNAEARWWQLACLEAINRFEQAEEELGHREAMVDQLEAKLAAVTDCKEHSETPSS
jgi:hypothetical protein